MCFSGGGLAVSKIRIIRRYQNRKLYDTQASKYVTLEDIALMIKEGVDVKVVDNRTKKDLTGLTLTQIIFEQEKRNKSILPLSALKRIIQSKSESISELVDRLITPGMATFVQARQEMEKVVDRLVRRGKIKEEDRHNILTNFYAVTQKGMEDITGRFEENVKKLLERTRTVSKLSERIARLEREVEDLEEALKKKAPRKPRKPKAG